MFKTPVAGLLVLIVFGQNPPAAPTPGVTARGLSQNPLITTRSSATLGDNINGPAVIRVPPWVKQPLGRYYMYFAHHMGGFIRLAFADAIEGPWKVYEPGVMQVRETALYRPQPDPPENLENFYTHVASPEIEIDHERQRLVMWFHGWWTEGKRWPAGDAPERILMSTISLSGDWSTWIASTPIEVLQPAAPYECATLPNTPSEAGDIKGPARQLRDPAIFEENGRTFLFYSFCGEQGIAAAELTFQR